ncbi:hypothetical protein SCALM49S_09028 [Streptomyces californicus]
MDRGGVPTPPRFVPPGVSDKIPEGNRSARERLARQREQEKGREKRRRTLIVASAVVGVLALAAVVGLIAANVSKDGGEDTASGPAIAPSGASGEDALTLPVGAADAPSTLTIWEDFRCPVCAQFENALRDTVSELVNDGQVRVEYHLATIIDGNLGGSGSLRAANAAACAQDAGKFAPYHDVLFQQPAARAGRRLRQEQPAHRAGREGPGARHAGVPQLCGGRRPRQLGEEVRHRVP